MKDNRYLNADDKLMLELIEKIEDAGLRTKLLEYYISQVRKEEMHYRRHIPMEVSFDAGTKESYLAEVLSTKQVPSSDMKVINNDEEELYDALNQLTADERQLIKFFFFDGKSERQVALMFGLSQKGVHQRKVKILAKLKKMIKK